MSAMTYHGLNLWAQGVNKAGTTDRMKVIEALETGLSFVGPAGKTTIDPQTYHCILDAYIAEGVNQQWKVLEFILNRSPQIPPRCATLPKTRTTISNILST